MMSQFRLQLLDFAIFDSYKLLKLLNLEFHQLNGLSQVNYSFIPLTHLIMFDEPYTRLSYVFTYFALLGMTICASVLQLIGLELLLAG